MEVVGEFLGMDADKGIHEYFARHYAHFFPVVGTVHRTARGLVEGRGAISCSFRRTRRASTP